jgi:hypothetical protein
MWRGYLALAVLVAVEEPYDYGLEKRPTQTPGTWSTAGAAAVVGG